MKAECTMENAQAAAVEHRFLDAAKLCDGLIAADPENREAVILAAKCLVSQTCGEKEHKKQERIRRTVAAALGAAQDADEIRRTEDEILTAMCEWESEVQKNRLKELKDKARLMPLKDYFETGSRYQAMARTIREEGRKAAEALGVEPLPLSGAAPEQVLAEELAQLETEISRAVFQEVRVTVQFHGTGTGREISGLLRSSIEMLTVAQVLAARANLADCPEELHRKRLENEAEIVHWALECVVHPDGKTISLYCSGREEMRDKLKTIYAELSKLDPGFKAPELPAAFPMNTCPEKAQKKGFFGRRK